jgi:hypothetical protein
MAKRKRKMGMHKMAKSNPFAGDLKVLESYGKALTKKKFTPVVEPRLAKVSKPKALFR